MIEKTNTVLKSCFEQERQLRELIDYQEDSVVSKTIIDKKAGTITIFAFDKGQGLSKHQAPFDATVYVIEGQAIITIGENEHTVSAGQIIIMPANVAHSVKAKERFKMLLIMIRNV
jgi:quercetin dioxygenase-like cupin family protein